MLSPHPLNGFMMTWAGLKIGLPFAVCVSALTAYASMVGIVA